MHRLFVGRNVLEEMYPALRGRPMLLPLYQVKRWLRLLDPRKRKAAVLELERAHTVSRETVRTYDELLKTLGL